MADAIRSGMAEGEADALALAADKQGVRGFVIAAAFAAAYDRLAGNTDIAQQAQGATAGMVDGAASDIGSALADQAGDGGSEDDMTGAVDEAVSGDRSRSVSARLGDSLWSAIGAGILALYMLVSSGGADDIAEAEAGGTGTGAPPIERPGMVMVSWVTDGNPCAVCVDNQAGSPYAPQDVPQYLAHPHCRCELYTYSDIPSPFFAAYLLS